MIKVLRKSVLVEFPKTLEEGAEELCETPYKIERVETNESIIWFGYHTNWKFTDGKWQKWSVTSSWEDCEEPPYETLYQNLLKED